MRNKDYPLYVLPRVSSVCDMLERQARAIPNKVAFRYRRGRDAVEEKTYADVCCDVRRSASWIAEHYGSNNRIAIIGENSYEWLVAFFATLASKNVAVPIDKELPAYEVTALADLAEVSKAFVSKTYSDLVEGIDGLEALTLRQLRDLEGTDSQNYGLHRPADDELACIFFTSGTSGKSKGVMLSHGSITAEINESCSLFDAENLDTLSVLPFHHAFGLVIAIFSSLNSGLSIFLNRSLKRLSDDLLLAKPGLITLVPLFIEVFHKQIMGQARASGREKKLRLAMRASDLLLRAGIDLRRVLFREVLDSLGGRLKYIICGGAYLDTFYIREFRSLGIDIFYGYGTTECAPCVSMGRNHYWRDGSVGLLLPSLQARTTPEGEIQVKGPITMMGYCGDPEGTAAVLKDGWYSTGDLGYVDPDRFLFLTGRVKNLIILSNGENISPEELENDFLRDPGVCEVLVYEKGNKIVAQIYPEEEYLGDTAYFDALMKKVNEGRSLYKQVASVTLRDQEFVKNASKKIVRHRNIPQG